MGIFYQSFPLASLSLTFCCQSKAVEMIWNPLDMFFCISSGEGMVSVNDPPTVYLSYHYLRIMLHVWWSLLKTMSFCNSLDIK
jgi:hypothetical protein